MLGDNINNTKQRSTLVILLSNLHLNTLTDKMQVDFFVTKSPQVNRQAVNSLTNGE